MRQIITCYIRIVLFAVVTFPNRSCPTANFISKIILHWTDQRGRRWGRRRKSRKSCIDNNKQWTGCSISILMRVAEDSKRWRILITDVSIVTPQWHKIEVAVWVSEDRELWRCWISGALVPGLKNLSTLTHGVERGCGEVGERRPTY